MASASFARLSSGLLAALALGTLVAQADAQCPEEGPFQHWTGGGTVACTCFAVGEEAGAIFDVPAAHYPIEILRIGVGWGSAVGGQPQTLEQAIHLYPSGLPNPGVPQFSVPGPVMTDGVINEFDLTPIPGNKIINSGPFTVTLEFANANAGGGPFTPTMVHDGNGCQGGKNVVFANPGLWFDACSLGVSGDWLVHIVYRPVNCSVGTELCFGDGSLTLCPCSNDSTPGNNEGCINSTGVGARLTATGTDVVLNDDLVLMIEQGRPNKTALFLQGATTISNPFRDGILCVGNPTERLEFVTLDSTGSASSSLSIVTEGMVSVGQIRTYQGWFRDGMGPCGMGSNLTQGLRISWQ